MTGSVSVSCNGITRRTQTFAAALSVILNRAPAANDASCLFLGAYSPDQQTISPCNFAR